MIYARDVLVLGLALTVLASPRQVAGQTRPPPRPTDEGSKRALHAVPEDDLYKSPINVLLSCDGSRLHAVCEDSDEVLAIDTASRRVVATAKVGRWPFDIAGSPDGRFLYVSNREGDSVTVLDTGEDRKSLTSVKTFPVGDNPHGLVTDASGKTLFVAHLHSDDVGIYDLETFKELKRLGTGRAPFELTRSPDGKRIYASSIASMPVPFRAPSVLEATFIDADTRTVAERRMLRSTIIAQDIAVSPDNRFAVTALELPKNLLPETQIYKGWMVTHGLAIMETGSWGRTAFILLDEPHLYYADAFGVQFSKDGKRLFVSSSGVDFISVVDFEKVLDLLKVKDGKFGITDEEIDRIARHLGISNEYVIARIPTGANPKGLALSQDGRTLYCAERLADSVLTVDTESLRPSGSIDLGGPKVVTELRLGATLFNSSTVSFQRQLSCTTCHPENHVDGLTYDIGLDGIGLNLVDNRTLRGIADTGPFKWNGKNPTIHRQEGPRAAMLFFRSHGYEQEGGTEAVVKFIEALPLLENNNRPKDGRLNEFQRRGKRLFERSVTLDGRYIPVGNRCITCHPQPLYTDNLRHDIGSRAPHDRDSSFDTPQLNNIQLQAPYLHDGRCYTLEEIWTVFNPDDTHGQTNDMTKEMLNDLIEYLKTL